MGTSEFAVPTLQAVVDNGHPLRAVVTQTDKPAGRGQKLQFSPVKRKALELQLPVYQPATLKDENAQAVFRPLQPDLIIVVAYGKILPPWLIALPRFGVLNLHGSLLPKYRGAAPIQWAVANGEFETGVCTMQIDEGLDTGPVYLCERTPIDPDEGVQALSERLASIGAALTVRTIAGLLSGSLHPMPQDHTRATSAPPLRRENGYINWDKPARAIHDEIRAFNPWPGTITRFRQTVCKILKSKLGQTGPDADSAGEIIVGRHGLAVRCGDGALLEVLEIQAPNRKPLSGKDFANGMRIMPGEKFDRITDN
jgi:methionyl-tRNA formyltransferase